MKRTNQRLAGALGAALILSAALEAAPVRTESGLVSGVVADGVVAYKGIPFAAPPVGDLRWRAPRPVPRWEGVRAADAYGHDCMQLPFPSDAAPLGTPPAENCLYLNVWAPETPASKEAEATGVAFAKLAGVAGEDDAALAALRRLPAEDLVRGLNMASMRQQRDTWPGPMIDGRVVVEEPEAAFRAGRQARIPYLVGANDREFGMMPLPPQAVEGMLARFGADRDAVVAAYDPEKTGNMGEVGVGLMSDGAMVEPARLLARLASAAGPPTFAYRFS